MIGWGARTWADVILTAIHALVGLGFLLWRPKPGRSWWSWWRLFGAAIIVVALVFLFAGHAQTRGGLINHGTVMAGIGLWGLFAGVWSVNGPDIPSDQLLRRNARIAGPILLYAGIVLVLAFTIPG